MRILPIALIAVGTYGVLRHYGLVDPEFLRLAGPVALIALGVALYWRGPRWRSEMHNRLHGKWERRMHRHFGPGWANLSDAERDRFRTGMRQWHAHPHHRDGDSPTPPPAGDAPPGSRSPS